MNELCLIETPSIIKFLNDTDSFLWQSQGTVKNASEEYLYFDFQSDEYKDLYIAADTIGNYIVKGMVIYCSNIYYH